MPDWWDSLPEEMLGERPAIQLISKQVETPKEVEAKESGRKDEGSFSKVYGSPEVK